MQAMKDEPAIDFKCKDKFLVQSVAITAERDQLPQQDLVRIRCQLISYELPTPIGCIINLAFRALLAPQFNWILEKSKLIMLAYSCSLCFVI